jgi:hypothetical protein
VTAQRVSTLVLQLVLSCLLWACGGVLEAFTVRGVSRRAVVGATCSGRSLLVDNATDAVAGMSTRNLPPPPQGMCCPVLGRLVGCTRGRCRHTDLCRKLLVANQCVAVQCLALSLLPYLLRALTTCPKHCPTGTAVPC